MPLPWDEAAYQRAYRVRVRDPRAPDYGLHYTMGKRFAERIEGPHDDNPTFFIKRAVWLAEALRDEQPETIHRALLVGSGFGYLLDALRDRYGWVNIWGVDASPYIAAHMEAEKTARTPVATYDIRQMTRTQIVNALRAWTGSEFFDVIITENLVMGHEDETLLLLAQLFESLMTTTNRRRIVHYVSPLNPHMMEHGLHDLTLGIRWLAFDEWVAKRPTHSWIDWTTGEVAS